MVDWYLLCPFALFAGTLLTPAIHNPAEPFYCSPGLEAVQVNKASGSVHRLQMAPF